MKKIDRIVFGDNQFFGINHMSQEKAQQLSEKFYDIKNIFYVYDKAIESGIQGIMLNSNDRAKEICTHFSCNSQKYGQLRWYPSIPYPHKYANMIAEKGIMNSINELLLKDSSATQMINMIVKGGAAVIGRDFMKIMQMLVDMEMKMFTGLDIQVVFLQNVITDLMLGFQVKEVFYEYCNYIRKKYKSLPGFITQNMPFLKSKLEEWGIHEVVICTSFNKIGYLMSPDTDAYIKSIQENDSEKYQIMAMSTMASGAIPAKEAYDYLLQYKIQSFVFGASSQKNIADTISYINRN